MSKLWYINQQRILGGAAAVPWYLAGGTALANCVAVYQPQGAASYAASKLNLINPLTHALVAYSVEPSWDITNGWTMDVLNQTILITDIIPAFEYSVIVKFSGVLTDTGSQGLVSSIKTVGGVVRFGIIYTPNLAGMSYEYNDPGVATTTLTGGVMAVTKTTGYKNGVPDKSIGATSLTGAIAPWIGGISLDGAFYGVLNGCIQAVAFYDITLSDAEVAAKTTAMNALPF